MTPEQAAKEANDNQQNGNAQVALLILSAVFLLWAWLKKRRER